MLTNNFSAAVTAVIKTVQIGTVQSHDNTTYHQGYLDLWIR